MEFQEEQLQGKPEEAKNEPSIVSDHNKQKEEPVGPFKQGKTMSETSDLSALKDSSFFKEEKEKKLFSLLGKSSKKMKLLKKRNIKLKAELEAKNNHIADLKQLLEKQISEINLNEQEIKKVLAQIEIDSIT